MMLKIVKVQSYDRKRDEQANNIVGMVFIMHIFNRLCKEEGIQIRERILNKH